VPDAARAATAFFVYCTANFTRCYVSSDNRIDNIVVSNVVERVDERPHRSLLQVPTDLNHAARRNQLSRKPNRPMRANSRLHRARKCHFGMTDGCARAHHMQPRAMSCGKGGKVLLKQLTIVSMLGSIHCHSVAMGRGFDSVLLTAVHK
jgi:hypothetical protein